ncbi:MAG: hypothetical protein EBQ99_09600, partial [Planctomycetes bacterium]|nr:hypothetical protein [Planctomycetota bacterium]
MPRRRERLILAVLLLLTGPIARAEELGSFMARHDLRATRVEWLLRELPRGGAAARDAARALAAEDVWMNADSGLAPEARREALATMVASMPSTDRAAGRPRVDLAGHELNRVSRDIDAMRGRTATPAQLRSQLESLQLVQDMLWPLIADPPARGPDPAAEWRPRARLLDGWRRLMRTWLMRRLEPDQTRREAVELERAKLVLTRLVDADDQSPTPANASRDLLQTDLGADAALGLVVALAMQGQHGASAEWARAVQMDAARLDAARRLPAWLLALAVDAGDVASMRRAIEAMPPRTLSAELAVAAATVASERPSADAEAVMAAAIDAMPRTARLDWLKRLGEGDGRLRALAVAMRQAAERLPAWQDGRDDGAAESARALRQALDGAAQPPASLHGEALRLLGWSLWRSGDAAAASRSFEQAAFAGPAFRSECLWLAALASPDPQGPSDDRRLRLLQAQRDGDPRGPWVGRVTIWLSRLEGFDNPAAAIAALLEVPPEDPFVADVRCEAARRILLQAGMDPDAQAEAARRALRALEPVRRAPQAARWRLIASLVPGVQDGAAASEALAALSPADRADPAVAAAVARWSAMQGDLQGVRSAVAAVETSRRAATALQAAISLADQSTAAARLAEMELALQAARGSQADLQAAAVERLAQAVVANAELDAPLGAELAREIVPAIRALRGPADASLALAEAL